MEPMAQEDGRDGWVLVAVGGTMGCIAIGAMFSLAVFQQAMVQDTGWSRTAISTAMTLNFLAMGVAGFAWGALSDRFGARIVVLTGSALLGLGLVAASRASSEGAFLLWPVIGGWIFDTYGRYTGMYLASMGIGLAAVALAMAFPRIRSTVIPA